MSEQTHDAYGKIAGEVARREGFPLYLSLPDSLPVGLPSTLLKRRPDVRGAELRLEAAMANVGLKYADRFPSMRLSVTGGWENDEVSHWLQSPFTYLLGNVAGTIFDWGKRSAAIRRLSLPATVPGTTTSSR